MNDAVFLVVLLAVAIALFVLGWTIHRDGRRGPDHGGGGGD